MERIRARVRVILETKALETKAVIVLQRVARGHRVTVVNRTLRRMATVIQCAYRMYNARRELKTKRTELALASVPASAVQVREGMALAEARASLAAFNPPFPPAQPVNVTMKRTFDGYKKEALGGGGAMGGVSGAASEGAGGAMGGAMGGVSGAATEGAGGAMGGGMGGAMGGDYASPQTPPRSSTPPPAPEEKEGNVEEGTSGSGGRAGAGAAGGGGGLQFCHCEGQLPCTCCRHCHSSHEKQCKHIKLPKPSTKGHRPTQASKKQLESYANTRKVKAAKAAREAQGNTQTMCRSCDPRSGKAARHRGPHTGEVLNPQELGAHGPGAQLEELRTTVAEMRSTYEGYKVVVCSDIGAGTVLTHPQQQNVTALELLLSDVRLLEHRQATVRNDIMERIEGRGSAEGVQQWCSAYVCANRDYPQGATPSWSSVKDTVQGLGGASGCSFVGSCLQLLPHTERTERLRKYDNLDWPDYLRAIGKENKANEYEAWAQT
jgi:hypothetical protein